MSASHVCDLNVGELSASNLVEVVPSGVVEAPGSDAHDFVASGAMSAKDVMNVDIGCEAGNVVARPSDSSPASGCPQPSTPVGGGDTAASADH